MADEAKQNEQAEAPQKETTGGKGGLMKYVIFGVVAVALTAGVTFATLKFIGGQESATEDGVTETQAEEAAAGEHETGPETAHEAEAEEPGELADTDLEVPEELLESFDDGSGALDKVNAALDFLDYAPDEGEVSETESDAAYLDSLQEAIKKEQQRLQQWEADLKKREKELAAREQRLSKQLLKLEQAESARISKLAKLYDGMEPRAVAKLMANLDDETVTAILPRMKPKNASAVLAMIPPKRAARLSRMMITIAEN